jgi:hypothetical protein
MSDLGQSRHFGRVAVTSGPPPIPDILSAHRHVSKVPSAEVAAMQGADGRLSPFRSGTGRTSQSNSKPKPVVSFLTVPKEPLFAYSADVYRVLLSRLSTLSGASGRRYVVLSR